MGDKKIRLSVERDAEREETRAKTNRRTRRVEKLKAQDVGKAVGSPRTASSLEGEAVILSDKRLSDPANRGQVADAMVALQKQQGNAYVQRVVKRLQAAAENEAREEYLEKTVQDLQQQKGSGHPLEGETRKEMEQSLGYDFDQVRLHTDGPAHKAAEELNAKAFTMGTDIFFSQKQGGNLSSSEGKGLLAHELTHVVQQSEGNLTLPGDKVKMGQPGDMYETEADKVAENAAMMASVQRQPEEEEELLQGKLESNALQRQVEEEEEEIQAEAEDLRLQRQEEEEEEEPIQTKRDDVLAQRQVEEEGGSTGAAPNPKTEVIAQLKNAVEKLRTGLEREQIKDLLHHAARCQVLGADAAAKEALDEAADIAVAMLKRKTAGFDVQFAKREMVTELLNAAADVLKLGGDEKAVESAMKKALDWAEAQLALAVEKFKTTPTEATARQVLVKAADVMLLGGDATEAMDLFMAWKEESGKVAESATAG